MAELEGSTVGEKALYGKNVRIHTTVEELGSSVNSTSPLENASPSRSKPSPVSDFLLPCAIMILPTTVLAVLLLYFVFHYQQHPPTFANPDLRVPFNETSTAHYYVNFQTSRISTMIGKFTTAAGFATSTAMALLAIPIARRIFAKSQQGVQEALPTPYQLTLLISVFNNGGMGALFKYLKYQFAFGSKRARIPSLLPVCVAVLTLFILLQYGMIGIETWLSTEMSTVSYLRVNQTSPPTYGAGRVISPACATLVNASTGYAVLGNVSEVHTLVQYDGYMLPIPSDVPSGLDYTASTFAVKTQCKPITSACQTSPVNGSFSCGNAGYNFAGAFSYTPGQGSLFKHSDMNLQFTDPIAAGGPNCTTPSNNCWRPLNTAMKGHFALATTIDFDTPYWQSQADTTRFGTGPSNFIILGCDYYAYTATYSMVNGAISSIATEPMNLTTFYTLNAPVQNKLGDDFMRSQLTPLAAASNTVAGIAKGFAPLFSRAFLGLSAGALSTRVALAEQTRSTLLVAKIPKSLFWLNVAVPFTFAALGLAILLWAAIGHSGEGGKEVKERMSLEGLVAQRYIPVSAHSPKEVDELFKESERNGADQKIVASRGRHGTWELKPSHEL